MTSDDRLQSSAPRITQDSLAPIRRNATWLLVVFLLALSFFAIHSLVERYDQLRNASLDRKWMGASGSISRLIHELQRERGLSSGVIASRGERFGDMLVAQQKLTDASLGELQSIVRQHVTDQAIHGGVAAVADRLQGLRQRVSNREISRDYTVDRYTELVDALFDMQLSTFGNAVKSSLFRKQMAFVAFSQAKETADKERALLPDEKSGKVWGIFPKLMRMPWNDEHESPVFLDVRRWIPAGDVIDFGQGHTAVPVPSPLMPGGPLVVLGELFLNKSSFTGKPITLDTDTLTEKYGKVGDYLWKAAAPNFPGIPGTYATDALVGAGSGKTDAFGREQSLGQAALSSVGVKLASYPPDVLRQNQALDTLAKVAEVGRQIKAARRQFARGGITEDELQDKITSSTEKRKGYRQGLADKQEAAGMR